MIGAGLTACSSHLIIEGSKTTIASELKDQTEITSFISPFKDSMEHAMNIVLAESSIDLEAGRTSCLLGNWASDALFVNQTRNVKMAEPIFCLLNTGGLRSSIGKGPVTLGDIFRLMPFDNAVTWVRLPISSKAKIAQYLLLSGGEPISHAELSNGKLTIQGETDTTSHFWVITSDYLAKGGDKMDFFKDAVSYESKPTLLRDVFIQEAKTQKWLAVSPEIRIKL
jgi:2',3'-cyclic-nucleotide 2'-phosphodiesterase (5'-nucleotidase family)